MIILVSILLVVFLSGEEEKLKDKNGHLPFDVDTAMLDNREVQYYDIIQNAGEVLFVPSGWHHQVFNLVRCENESSVICG